MTDKAYRLEADVDHSISYNGVNRIDLTETTEVEARAEAAYVLSMYPKRTGRLYLVDGDNDVLLCDVVGEEVMAS